MALSRTTLLDPAHQFYAVLIIIQAKAFSIKKQYPGQFLLQQNIQTMELSTSFGHQSFSPSHQVYIYYLTTFGITLFPISIHTIFVPTTICVLVVAALNSLYVCYSLSSFVVCVLCVLYLSSSCWPSAFRPSTQTFSIQSSIHSTPSTYCVVKSNNN